MRWILFSSPSQLQTGPALNRYINDFGIIAATSQVLLHIYVLRRATFYATAVVGIVQVPDINVQYIPVSDPGCHPTTLVLRE